MSKACMGPLNFLMQAFTKDEPSCWWYRIPVRIRMFVGILLFLIVLSVTTLYLYAKHDVETYAASVGWSGRATLRHLDFSKESLVEMHFRINEFSGCRSYAGWSVRLRQPTYLVSLNGGSG